MARLSVRELSVAIATCPLAATGFPLAATTVSGRWTANAVDHEPAFGAIGILSLGVFSPRRAPALSFKIGSR